MYFVAAEALYLASDLCMKTLDIDVDILARV